MIGKKSCKKRAYGHADKTVTVKATSENTFLQVVSLLRRAAELVGVFDAARLLPLPVGVWS